MGSRCNIIEGAVGVGAGGPSSQQGGGSGAAVAVGGSGAIVAVGGGTGVLVATGAEVGDGGGSGEFGGGGQAPSASLVQLSITGAVSRARSTTPKASIIRVRVVIFVFSLYKP